MVEPPQVSKPRSTNVAPIGTLATVADNINTHFTLGGLYDGIGLARGDGVTLSIQKEVMNESLHVLLHGSTGGR